MWEIRNCNYSLFHFGNIELLFANISEHRPKMKISSTERSSTDEITLLQWITIRIEAMQSVACKFRYNSLQHMNHCNQKCLVVKSKPKFSGPFIFYLSLRLSYSFFPKMCIRVKKKRTKNQCWIAWGHTINMINFRLKLCVSIFVNCIPCNG